MTLMSVIIVTGASVATLGSLMALRFIKRQRELEAKLKKQKARRRR